MVDTNRNRELCFDYPKFPIEREKNVIVKMVVYRCRPSIFGFHNYSSFKGCHLFEFLRIDAISYAYNNLDIRVKRPTVQGLLGAHLHIDCSMDHSFGFSLLQYSSIYLLSDASCRLGVSFSFNLASTLVKGDGLKGRVQQTHHVDSRRQEEQRRCCKVDADISVVSPSVRRVFRDYSQ